MLFWVWTSLSTPTSTWLCHNRCWQGVSSRWAEDLRSCNTLRGCVVQMLVHTFVVVLNRPIWPIWLRDWCIYYMSIWRGYRARERSIKFGPISRRVNISFICPHALVWLFSPKSIFLPICGFAVYSAYNSGERKIGAPVSGIASGTFWAKKF